MHWYQNRPPTTLSCKLEYNYLNQTIVERMEDKMDNKKFSPLRNSNRPPSWQGRALVQGLVSHNEVERLKAINKRFSKEWRIESGIKCTIGSSALYETVAGRLTGRDVHQHRVGLPQQVVRLNTMIRRFRRENGFLIKCTIRSSAP